jgi:citrate synthase
VTEYLNTWIGSSDPDSITLAGLDLPTEVMGKLTLTELAFLLVTRRRPTDHERRVADAVLVSLADHGFTPTALATRLTYTGAPESVQGAVAAGLLGAGNVFLGPAGDTAQFLAEALGHHALDRALADDTVDELALAAVERCRAEQRRVPGLGHPVHRAVDPRTPRIYEIAASEGLLGPHLRLLQGVAAANEGVSGRRLPINGAGAGGAALADIGLPTSIIRGFVLIARTAGLVGHLAEEMDEPIGMPLWQEVERRAAQRDD